MLNRSQKSGWRDEVVASLDKANALFLAQYAGMTVEELTILRRELRNSNSQFQVIKNTIAQKAVAGRPEAVVADLFCGQTGTIFVQGDVVAAAKTISDYAKKNEKFKVVGGYFEANKMSLKDIETLASLPSREVLIAKILGSLVAPHRGLLGVLQGVPRALVSVLNQIKEEKEKAQAG